MLGYNYLGGHKGTPWPLVGPATAEWVSPRRSFDWPSKPVVTELNAWSTGEMKTFATARTPRGDSAGGRYGKHECRGRFVRANRRRRRSRRLSGWIRLLETYTRYEDLSWIAPLGGQRLLHKLVAVNRSGGRECLTWFGALAQTTGKSFFKDVDCHDYRKTDAVWCSDISFLFAGQCHSGLVSLSRPRGYGRKRRHRNACILTHTENIAWKHRCRERAPPARLSLETGSM